MKKRIITGTVYVIVVLALLALKWLVPVYGAIGFDVAFCAVSILGSLELLNAVKDVSFPQKAVTVAFCSLVVPLYAVMEMATGTGFIAIAVALLIYLIALFVLWAFRYEGSTSRSTLLSVFTMVYCGVLCCVLSAINHLSGYTVAAILLLFMIVMLTDSVAFAVGLIFKRWVPYKLAPAISPNKTIVGAIGGLIGGMGSAVAALYIYNALSPLIGTEVVVTGSIHPAVVFLLIGLVGSLFGQAGDLFESAIKRKCGIKDFGNILPGHGGILDRFDSMLFVGVIILISFAILIV